MCSVILLSHMCIHIPIGSWKIITVKLNIIYGSFPTRHYAGKYRTISCCRKSTFLFTRLLHNQSLSGIISSQAQRFLVKQNHFTCSWEVPVQVTTYHCVSTCFLAVVITMGEQVVPSAFLQCSIPSFLTKESVKPAEILTRLRAQVGD
jgi:hypothetical protein